MLSADDVGVTGDEPDVQLALMAAEMRCHSILRTVSLLTSANTVPAQLSVCISSAVGCPAARRQQLARKHQLP